MAGADFLAGILESLGEVLSAYSKKGLEKKFEAEYPKKTSVQSNFEYIEALKKSPEFLKLPEPEQRSRLSQFNYVVHPLKSNYPAPMEGTGIPPVSVPRLAPAGNSSPAPSGGGQAYMGAKQRIQNSIMQGMSPDPDDVAIVDQFEGVQQEQPSLFQRLGKIIGR